MKKKRPDNQSVQFIDNPHAPEFYADSVSGAFMLHGNVRLTFESGRVDHITTPGPVNRVVSGRLVMPRHAIKNLRDFLSNFLNDEELHRVTQGGMSNKLQ
ncbi:MAG: hypothetical protein RIC85_00610 [Gammaproteobacteria bacterium]